MRAELTSAYLSKDSLVEAGYQSTEGSEQSWPEQSLWVIYRVKIIALCMGTQSGRLHNCFSLENLIWPWSSLF